MSEEERIEAPEEGGQGELYGVTREQVAEFRAALDAGDTQRCEDIALGLHAADLADLIERLAPPERHLLVALIGPHLAPEILTFLEDPVREEILRWMEAEHVAAAVTELETDDAVGIVEGLEAPVQAEVLGHLEDEDRALVEEALSWPEDSAGRLMQREFVALPSFWTVGDTIDDLREKAEKGGEDLPVEFFDLFVVDEAFHPVGSVSLSRLLRNRRPVRLEDLMVTDIHAIPVATDQEEVALLFRQYDLASAPVVDDDGRLVGVITHDDVLDVIHEEAEEDIMRLGGVHEDDLYHAVLRTSRSRISWLVLSLLGLFSASVVIWFFQGTIEQIVALAILMPIVAALGGNAGIQTMTVSVRALAMKELHGGNAHRIIGKEFLVAAINGLALAAVVGTVAALWFSTGIGLIIGGAIIANLLAAGFVGVLIPLTLERCGVDPAVASSVFLITVTDTLGFAAFLGAAALFLL